LTFPMKILFVLWQVTEVLLSFLGSKRYPDPKRFQTSSVSYSSLTNTISFMFTFTRSVQ
jgi:hypothetical protein